MKKEDRNLKESINKAMKTSAEKTESRYSKTDFNDNEEEIYKYDDIDSGDDYIKDESFNSVEKDNKNKKIRKILDRPLKIFGGICLAIGVAALIFSGSSSVDTSESAKEALNNKISTAISQGTILMKQDENIGAKDYTITHKSNEKDTKIWVWDYAAEDGDYVQIFVDGVAYGDAFMIRNKPKEITIPASGNVQVKGIRDGGGGITYAVRYDINGTSYFNGVSEGKANTYTLIREQ